MSMNRFKSSLVVLAIAAAPSLVQAVDVDDLDVTITVIESEAGDAGVITREITLPDGADRGTGGRQHRADRDHGFRHSRPGGDKAASDSEITEYQRSSKETRDRARETHGDAEAAAETARENHESIEEAHDAAGDAGSDGGMTDDGHSGDGAGGDSHDSTPDGGDGGMNYLPGDSGGSDSTADRQTQHGSENPMPETTP